ncbi:ORF6N domain-containing protein [Fulvivirgaceae bacterium BMA12]|uniref:ORF6N domain-containing protein n=1 Tax=Agaribacillus aureus TaxID=3051825 RepID=A0ABT8LHA5_9BACT|nr:ORF6N domain-containing protein [Fulvivirgaceae bacterium BMA12]
MQKIYLIRGQKVMLDRDLADLYGVENKRLGEQVKRNINKFPEDFMFQLSKQETDDLRSHFATANISNKSRVLPTVLTEHGILMLANVLSSERANNVSIQIIRIFTKMREMIVTQKDILLKIEQLERKGINHDKNIKQIFQVLKQLVGERSKPREPIGFKIRR